METAEFIETLRREGRLLAAAAARAGLPAPVPTCPGWRVRDLLGHTGAVHLWAADYVLTGRAEPHEPDDAFPPDAELVDWYGRTHAGLTRALAAAPAGLACWTFLPAPSPLAFWARRQAHETTVHRMDAEAALGLPGAGVDPAFAADGVDELLTGFHARRRSRVRTDRPRTLLVRAVDTGHHWLVRLSQEPPVTRRGPADAADGADGTGAEDTADCTVSGTAAGLYRALWNRGSYDALAIEGDDSLVELWRRTAAVE
jgi:uncharacterized protein (TIGR03083 family)